MPRMSVILVTERDTQLPRPCARSHYQPRMDEYEIHKLSFTSMVF